MKITKDLFIVFCILLSTGSLFNLYANGGPDDGCTVYKTGDPHFLKKKDVELISEKLSLSIQDNYIEVHVIYRLYNRSDKSTGSIHYGFPVEYIYMDCCDTIWDDDYVKSISFKYNDKKLAISGSSTNPEASYRIANKDDQDGDDSEESKHWRRWFYTEFSIPAKELITLEVRYVIKNNYEDYSTSKSSFSGYGERQLYYDFSPASYWGNGIVKDFQVIIDVNKTDIDSLQISGLNFKKDGNNYTFNVVDFNLASAQPLHLIYDITGRCMSADISSRRLNKKHILSMNASSVLEGGYHVENIFDGDFSTAWAEGKPDAGVGEWIEIELKKDIGISGIVLVNGYTKSSKTYRSNNRIKKLKLEMEVEIIEDGKVKKMETLRSPEEIELEDLPYQVIDVKNFFKMSSIIYDAGDFMRRMNKIKLTILDVYKGAL